MGGHVVTASLEMYPDVYQAGLAECGLVDGIWESDYLSAYTAAAEYVSGVRFFDAPDRQAFGGLIPEWLKIMGKPGEYTARGKQFDSLAAYLTGVNLPFRI